MKKRRSIYESMTRLTIGPLTVRVWRSEAKPSGHDRRDVGAMWARLLRCRTTAGMIRAIQSFPRIAAIEITNAHGDGIVVYNDWP